MLDKEFKYFLDNQRELVSKFNNKYIIIIGNEVKGSFKSHHEAYLFGQKNFGLGKFLIQQCLPGELATTITFHSQIYK